LGNWRLCWICRWIFSLQFVLCRYVWLEALDDRNLRLSIVLQIASNMHPRDLLYLSRATKHFRNMFMTKESRLVWRAAFENVDVPEHPDALSEPLYAALLYDNHCMVRTLPVVTSVCRTLMG
jgi:hypothetical protein